MTSRAGRDRDAAGRAQNARPRDALGRPLPRPPAGRAPGAGSPPSAGGAPALRGDLALAPGQAAELGARLLADGRPFQAHEVFEAAWKSIPGPSRELWRGLAQVAVGITHARRGNASGAAALLRRGAERVAAFAGTPADVDPGLVAAQASALAERIERDGLAAVTDADLRLKLRP